MAVESHEANKISPDVERCTIHLRQLILNCLYVICDLGSVLLRQRCDMLCTSGFVDDVNVIFFHRANTGPYDTRDASKVQAECDPVGVTTDLTPRSILKLTHPGAAPDRSGV